MEIKTKKASELASDYIENLIRENEFQPGDKLPSIKEWSKTLKLSNGTIREAINILKTKGIIEVKQGEGTFVRKIELSEIAPMMNMALIQKNDLKELMEFRNIFEIGAVQLATQFRTNEDLREMKEALEDFQSTQQDKRQEADFRFHVAITTACHNSLVQFLYHSISPALRSLINRYGHINQTDDNVDDHAKIYESIEKQDLKQSIFYMEKHLNGVFKEAFPES